MVIDNSRFVALERVTRFFKSDSYFYELCGVDKNDSIESLKSARNAFLKKNHPDKAEDFSLDLFMKTAVAFKVLMNSESRMLYDKNGKRFRKRLIEHKNDIDKTIRSFEKDSDFKHVFQKMIKNTFK